MIWSAENLHASCVKLLLDAGADVHTEVLARPSKIRFVCFAERYIPLSCLPQWSLRPAKELIDYERLPARLVRKLPSGCHEFKAKLAVRDVVAIDENGDTIPGTYEPMTRTWTPHQLSDTLEKPITIITIPEASWAVQRFRMTALDCAIFKLLVTTMDQPMDQLERSMFSFLFWPLRAACPIIDCFGCMADFWCMADAHSCIKLLIMAGADVSSTPASTATVHACTCTHTHSI